MSADKAHELANMNRAQRRQAERAEGNVMDRRFAGVPILQSHNQPEQMASFVKTPDGKTVAMPYVTVGLFDQGALHMLIGALVPHIAEAVYQRFRLCDAPDGEVPLQQLENPPAEGDLQP